MAINPDFLPLQRLYRWAKERPSDVYMTQPMGGSEVRTYNWSQVLDEASLDTLARACLRAVSQSH